VIAVNRVIRASDIYVLFREIRKQALDTLEWTARTLVEAALASGASKGTRVESVPE